MNRQKDEFYWKRLDNAGKIFPAVVGRYNSSVYRVGAKLTQPVQPELLRQAVNKALEQLPLFRVKLRRGLFWYYYENNPGFPVVQEDRYWPCRRIEKREDKGFQFRVCYFGKKINLEVFHALTDGTGALILLKRILAQYLTLCYPGQVSGEDPEFEWKACVPAMEEDSYLKLRDPSVPFRHGAGKKAYQIQGTRYLNARLDVTQGKCSASQVAALAKGMGVTVTAYLTGLLIHSIYTANGKFSKKPKPIVVSVPVNLRSLFPSQTLRNFFHFITVQVDYSQKEYTLKETVEQVATQLKEQADPSKLTAPLAFHVNAQYHLAVRFVPLFLKNWVLHLIYHLGEENYTSTLSNLGRMSLPEDEKPYVEHFEVLNNVTKRQCFKVGVCTLGDRMVVSFISGMEEKEIERWFFRHLSEQGIEVTIASNQPRVPDREG